MIYGWLLLAVLIIWGLCELNWYYNEIKEWVIGQYIKIEKAECKIDIIEGRLALEDSDLLLFDLDREELKEEKEELLKKLDDLLKEKYVRKEIYDN